MPSDPSVTRTVASVASAEVLVLGAGVIGTAVAAELGDRGLDVLLLDAAAAPGTGSSGRCDGNVLVQTKHDDLLVRLTLRSIDAYRRWQDELEPDIRFEQRGSLVVAADEEQLAGADRRARRLGDLGVPCEVLDGDALGDAEPHLVPGLPGALWCDADAEVYPPTLVAALFGRARSSGCRFLPGVRALRLLVAPDGGVRGVATTAGEVHGRWVVNALGAGSAGLDPVVPDARVVVEPRHGVLVVTAGCAGLVRHNIREAGYLGDRAHGDAEPGETLVSFAAEPTYRGNLLLGSSRSFRGHGVGVDWRAARRIVRRACAFVPALACVPVLRTFAGVRPWTPDGLPLIGPSTAVPGYVLATGHEGEGIGLAPATAQLVAAAVTGEQTDEETSLALRVLSPDRWSDRPGVGAAAVP